MPHPNGQPGFIRQLEPIGCSVFALQSSVFTVLLDQAFYLSQRISRHLPNITGYQSFVCYEMSLKEVRISNMK
jgi:hypothetical protein